MAGVFYLLMVTGCTWIAGAFLYELCGSREESKNAPTHSRTRSARGLRGAPGHGSKRVDPDDPQSTDSAIVVTASVTARRIKTLS